ncbi:uncharacterized protein LOC133529214 isoform X1 [Cydia pomonella]|uniref:uncharacterized protein LOC133529214 isoform X1 n=1 Tax=Cydia pomonella TaxID=82600 RepID=UPI002ADE442B|nr:uncharacterized protein LOC133529214 isoform X1 [Cydia pomonella]
MQMRLDIIKTISVSLKSVLFKLSGRKEKVGHQLNRLLNYIRAVKMAGSWLVASLVLVACVQFALCDLPYKCEKNSNCPENLACESSECADPCLKYRTCGSEAHCVVEDYSAKCICNEGTAGDPYEKCTDSTLPLLISGQAIINMHT